MELPVKIEVPKLSHLHMLELLLPLIPGIVITTGLSLSDSKLFQKLWSLGLGYKSKLTLMVALSYIIGIAMIAVVQACTSITIGGIRKKVRVIIPWENSYWRRIAESYVGGELSPKTASFPDTADLISAAQSALGRYKEAADIQTPLATLQKQIQLLEEPVKRLQDVIASVPSEKVELIKGQIATSSEILSKATPKLQQLREVLQEVETGLRFIGTEFEWRSLHNALEMLSTPASPYAGFSLLMSALQASGIGALWLMVQHKELRNLPGFIFSGLVAISASYGLWWNYWVSGNFTDLNSFQIAAMIKEIRRRTAVGKGENQKEELSA